VAVSPYDEIAEWYDGWLGPDKARDDFLRAVEELMGEVAGLRVLDLACGQGRVARRLADLGARVTGVDLSTKLLEIARWHEAEAPRWIDYRHGDAHTLKGVTDGAFDGVLCYMALMDIPDLDAALHSAARVLRPGGWLLLAIIHPCYNPPPSGELATPEGWVRTVRGYWEEGYWRSETRTGPPGKVGSYHRTLSTYVDALTDAGFVLERMREPRATGRSAELRPVWAEVPATLAVRCRKPAAASGAG